MGFATLDDVLDGWLTISVASGDTLIGWSDYDRSSPILSFPIGWTGGTGRFVDGGPGRFVGASGPWTAVVHAHTSCAERRHMPW
jgi:hypothetical protein